MTSLTEFINEQTTAKAKKGVVKISASIQERWQSRVVAQGLNDLGAAGAEDYLTRYGKGISAGKVIDLALCAQANGAEDMARVFWAKAYELTLGAPPPDEAQADLASVAAGPAPQADARPTLPNLPQHLQPGQVITMQPVDAPRTRNHYITNPRYYGQPKRDGHRLVVIASPEGIHYQARSTKLQGRPNAAIDAALKDAVARHGAFVLDGELWHQAAAGSEHRTAAEAAEANLVSGQPKAPVKTIYTVFKALYAHGRDLLSATEDERLEAARNILPGQPDCIEICPTACTAEHKALLVSAQQLKGREGEIWVAADAPYVGGMRHEQAIVRTKYIEEIEVLCTGLTPTDADGRLFGAMEVAEEKDGMLAPIGKVGTGFPLRVQRQITERFEQEGPFSVRIATQGRTAKGAVWHARFLGFS